MNKKRLRPKKELGQVLLVDPKVCDRIISASNLQSTDTVLEIGPGEGILTRGLSVSTKEVIAVEIDHRYFEKLSQELGGRNVHLIHADFLKFDIENLPKNLIAVSNLPYYLSSPIIEKLINYRRYFRDLYLTVQLEFGNRLAAETGTKDYGALSCFVQYYAEVKKLFKIKNASFRPIPKVDSCLVHLHIQPKPLYPAKNEEFLFRTIRQAFQKRRKTLTNAFAPIANREKLLPLLDSLEVNPNLRPENLTIKNFVDIANALCE